MRTITHILDEWRTAAWALADLDPADPADPAEPTDPSDPTRAALRARVDALRREYLDRFDVLRAGAPATAEAGDELPAVSDELLAAVSDLQSLLVERDRSGADAHPRLSAEIEAASTDILRLATLQRRIGDATPSQSRSTDDLDGGPPAAATADAVVPRDLGGVSGNLLRAARELRALEREKRAVEVSSPRFHELAARVEERARRIFRLADDDQEDADRTG